MYMMFRKFAAIISGIGIIAENPKIIAGSQYILQGCREKVNVCLRIWFENIDVNMEALELKQARR